MVGGLGREGFDRWCCPSGGSPLGSSLSDSLMHVLLPLWGFGHLGVAIAVAPLGFRLLARGVAPLGFLLSSSVCRAERLA